MTYFPDLFTAAVLPDIIEETPSGTFMGWFDRIKYDRKRKPHGQPIWTIRKVAVDGSFTEVFYPNGSRLPKFVWDDRKSYSYTYCD